MCYGLGLLNFKSPFFLRRIGKIQYLQYWGFSSSEFTKCLIMHSIGKKVDIIKSDIIFSSAIFCHYSKRSHFNGSSVFWKFDLQAFKCVFDFILLALLFGYNSKFFVSYYVYSKWELSFGSLLQLHNFLILYCVLGF